MTTSTFHRQLTTTSPLRQRVMGIFFLIVALAILVLFAGVVTPQDTATFVLVPGGSNQVLPPWVVTAQPMFYGLAAVCAVLGGIQLARGFKRWTNWILGVVALCFIFAFITWATLGQSLNLGGLLSSTLGKAVPITLGALSGILCERAGVVNIAIEGMMLTGAFLSTYVGSVTGSPWWGLLAAIVAGGLMALLHGVLSIKYKVNQIISGTVINILATGLTSYLSTKFLSVYQELNNPGVFPSWPIPLLSDIPIIGPILFDNNLFIYAMFIFLIVLQVVLFSTRWGLRLRAVGEHPKAADTLGINVFKTRYIAVVLGGMMAGLAGAYFTVGSVGRFDQVMTGGRGFIGLAAMIFGNWNPFGSFGAGLLFGFADGLASRLAILRIPIPSEVLLMLPYIATMVILAGVIGRSQAPAADGIPYEKEGG